MGQYGAALIDLDQTLIDSRECILRSFEEAFRQEPGLAIDRSRVLELWGHPVEWQMERLAGPAAAHRLVELFRESLKTQSDGLSVFPGWDGVLRTLCAHGCRLAVVTSKRSDVAIHQMTHLGLDRFFDVVVGADHTSRHKPAPEPFLLAASLLGLPSAECVGVGDSPWDIIGAHRAGMATALAEWDPYNSELLRLALSEHSVTPDFRLQAPGDLVAVCLAGQQPG